jgi:hypothetical protein
VIGITNYVTYGPLKQKKMAPGDLFWFKWSYPDEVWSIGQIDDSYLEGELDDGEFYYTKMGSDCVYHKDEHPMEIGPVIEPYEQQTNRP